MTAVLAAFVGLTAALHVLGVGGWRLGWLWVGISLVPGSAALTAVVLGHTPRRIAWSAAMAVCGLAAVGVLTQSAPLSKGVLAERIDRLSLPFFEEVSRRAGGHSWCRPECPQVERSYLPPDTANPDLPILTVLLALQAEGLLTEDQVSQFAGRDSVVAEGEDFTVTAALGRGLGGRHVVVVRFASHRR